MKINKIDRWKEICESDDWQLIRVNPKNCFAYDGKKDVRELIELIERMLPIIEHELHEGECNNPKYYRGKPIKCLNCEAMESLMPIMSEVELVAYSGLIRQAEKNEESKES